MFASKLRNDRSALISEVETAFKERRAPFSAMADAAGWCAALNETLTLGRLEAAVHAAGHLGTAFPTSNYLRNLFRIFERMPPADESYVPLQDLYWNDVQLARRENAKTVLFVLCGRQH